MVAVEAHKINKNHIASLDKGRGVSVSVSVSQTPNPNILHGLLYQQG
jgi:hypothetical protein